MVLSSWIKAWNPLELSLNLMLLQIECYTQYLRQIYKKVDLRKNGENLVIFEMKIV